MRARRLLGGWWEGGPRILRMPIKHSLFTPLMRWRGPSQGAGVGGRGRLGGGQEGGTATHTCQLKYARCSRRSGSGEAPAKEPEWEDEADWDDGEKEALPELREITKDDYHSCLAEAGDDLVVVDFYTTW